MSIRVVWPKNPEADVASYELQRSTTSGGPWTTIATIPQDQNFDPATQTYSYVDADGDNTSWYRLRAVDDANQASGWSSPFQVVVPSTPVGVTLRWSPSNDPDIARYRIEKSITISGPWSIVTNVMHVIPGDNYDDQTGTFFYEDLSGNQSAWYRITAVDAEEQLSPPSVPFRASTDTTALLPALVGAINITVGDVGTLLNLGFTHIELWHSKDDGGTWAEITGAQYAAASVTSIPAATTFVIGGSTLRYKVNGGAEVAVEFSDVLLQWTPQQVVDRINQVTPGLASLSGLQVVLTSPTVGRQSSLQIVYSPSDLGFEAGTYYGVDPRLQLQDGVVSYTYFDVSNNTDSRYKWRFSANGSQPVSVWSRWVYARETARDGLSLAIGKATFVSVDGRPTKTKILVAAMSTPAEVQSGVMIQMGKTEEFETDDSGYVEIPLIIGAKVRIAIERTGYVREFTVPNQTTFDLLKEMSDATDAFTVATVPPLLTRRSL